MASWPVPFLTEQQYLELERAAESKSEFHGGQMFAMAGGSPRHAILANRIGGFLDRRIPAGCLAFSSDLRIKAESAGLYTYPDCSVVCGELQFANGQRDVIINPLAIVEVLSPSTEAYDRGKKFEMYRRIDTFREYLLIHQDRPLVEHYSKQKDGGWLLHEHSGLDAEVEIGRLGVRISLAELYAGLPPD